MRPAPRCLIPACVAAVAASVAAASHATIEDAFDRNRAALENIVEQCSLDYQQQQSLVVELTGHLSQSTEASATAPLQVKLDDGRQCKLVKVIDGRPYYYISDNQGSAETISTDRVAVGGSRGTELDGSGVKLGIWDQYNVWASHIEFNGRVTNRDGAIASNHATHVAGTLVAQGIDAQARGMAPGSTLQAFNFDDDATEMAQQQLTDPPISISTHSYSLLTGWIYDFRDDNRWAWFGDESISETEDWLFGFYDEQTAVWDEIVFNSPYYLIVKSAGNDREDQGPLFTNQAHWVWNKNTGSFFQSYTARLPDGGNSGYDSLPAGPANGKNILVVGAVNAITGGYSSPVDASSAAFSSWGPTDDGRIKPDVVAQGMDVFSSFSSGNTRYGVLSGTSMATPAVSGSLALVVEHRDKLGGERLTAASLRGLAIHAADELGPDAGPDYQTGWGLFNTATAIDLLTAQSTAIYTDRLIELELNNGGQFTYTFQSSGNEDIKVTLAWTDPAGPVLENQLDPTELMLVNDLDLRLEGPDGNIFLPWVLDPAAPALGAQRGDNFRDNVEQVFIPQPPAGSYTLHVTHKGSLREASQSASLLLSGNADVSPVPAPPVFLTSPNDTAWVGFNYEYSFDNLVLIRGTFPINLELQTAPRGMAINQGSISWMPAPDQEGWHDVVISATNDLGQALQSFSVYVEKPRVDLSTVDTVAYGGQDRSGVVAVEDNGLSLRLEGNRARALPFDYAVTPDTRLAFEFSSNQQGEVHAIGLDNDLRLSAERTFQLYGTQTYGVQTYRDYPGGGVAVQYDIPLGEYYTGQMRYLFFLMDHDNGGQNGQGIFSQVRVYEAVDGVAPTITSSPGSSVVEGETYQYALVASGDAPLAFTLVTAPAGMQLHNGVISWTPSSGQVGTHSVTVTAGNAAGVDAQSFSVEVSTLVVEPPPEPEPEPEPGPEPEPEPSPVNYLQLDSVPSEPYGGQDRGGVVAVEDNGLSLRLEGNRARALPFDYAVTPDTRLAFEFSSNQQGEVHAIGLDNDLRLSAERTFQLYGTQTYGVQTYRDYPGGGVAVQYDIPLGEYYTGQMRYLFFLMDHDNGGQNGQGIFSQVRVYEAVDGVAPTITSSPGSSVVEGETYQYALVASGDAPLAFTLVTAPAGMQLHNGVISWTPSSGQVGTHSVTVTAGNAAGVDAQSFSVEVSTLVVEPPPEPEPEPEPGPEPEPEPSPVNYLQLDSVPSEPYGGQDRGGVVAVEDNGLSLRLEGNRARALPFDYAVTPDTRLAFEFSSNQQGEVHAIGLDNDLRLSAERTFQLYGTQTYGVQTYRDYPGGGVAVQYDIPLGEYYTGQMRYLFFLMDHDNGGQNGQGIFSQVRVYEAVDGVAPTITSSPGSSVVEGETYQYALVASGDAPLAFTLVTAPAGMQLHNGVISWTPSSGQVGTHSVTVTAGNAAGVDAQSFTVEVEAALVLPDYIDLNSYTFGEYGRNQALEGTATVDPDGATLRLRGNRLRQIPFEYEITPNTYLVFEFSSTRQGEVHAIGLDDNIFLSINRTFQLYGTQVYGQQVFNDYPGDGSTRQYQIPVGEYYTGPAEHLFFIMDHDVTNPRGESVFSKIRVFERD